jgi:hypothetical protein
VTHTAGWGRRAVLAPPPNYRRQSQRFFLSNTSRAYGRFMAEIPVTTRLVDGIIENIHRTGV